MKKEIDPAIFANLIEFTPDKWGEIERFLKFHYPTYKLTRAQESALIGVAKHLFNFQVLESLATRLISELNENSEEINEVMNEAIKKHGKMTEKELSSLAIKAQKLETIIKLTELEAIIEKLFSDLYSSVDCTRFIIGAIYGKYQGAKGNSAKKLFENAEHNKIDERVPLEIRKALKEGQNDWFPELKRIRDSINHYDAGYCFEEGGKIKFCHTYIGNKEKLGVLNDDVFKHLSELNIKIIMFQNLIYQTLNKSLKSEETIQDCGVFNFHIYQRYVSPYEALNFDSGRCKSRELFEKNNLPTCPYIDKCGAYKN